MQTVVAGRDGELAELQRRMNDSLSGRAVVCLVSGEAGAGKTSLLQAFVEQAQAGRQELLVACGSCNSFTGTGDPYLPFREILRLLTGDVEQGLAEGRANREGAARLKSFMRMSARALVENGPDLIDIFVPGGALLARLGGKAARKVGWLDELGARLGQPVRSEQGLSQDNVFEQYTQVLEAISSERPLMLVIDDLHWADHASLGLLFHLSRRLVNDPLFILGAYRDDQVSPSGQQLLTLTGELQRLHGDVVIDLGAHDARSIVDAIIDSSPNRLGTEFRAALSNLTAGNALFVTELLRVFVEAGTLAPDEHGRLTETGPIHWDALPPRISGIISARLSKVSGEQREMLELAAVHGDEFYADTVASVLGQPKRAIVRSFSGALQKELSIVQALGFRQAGDASLAAYGFHHSLFRHFLYEGLDPVERSSLHGEIGEALEVLAGHRDPVIVNALARHYAEAGNAGKAIRYSIRAGDNAAQSHAPRLAIEHYRQGLSLWKNKSDSVPGFDACPVMERLADQYLLAGMDSDAAEGYADALDMQPPAGVERSRLLRKRAVALQRLRQYEDATACLDEAGRLLEAMDKDDASWQEFLTVRLEYCWLYYWQNATNRLAATIEELEPLVARHGGARERAALRTAQIRHGLRATRFRPTPELERLADELATAGDQVDAQHPGPHFLAAFVALWAGRPEKASRGFETTLGLAQQRGDVVEKARCLVYLSVALRQLGDTAKLRGLLPEARELVEFGRAPEYVGVQLAQEAWLALREGCHETAGEKASAALDRWSAGAPRYPFKWLALWVRLALEDVRQRNGIESDAATLLDSTQMQQPETLARALVDLREACRTGSDEDVRRSLDDALALAREEQQL